MPRREIVLPLADGVPPAGGPRPVGRVLRMLAIATVVVVMGVLFLAILALAGAEAGPTAFTLALLLALAPVPVYVGLALWADRFEPEPLRLILLAFAWGATVACAVALVLNTAGEAIVGETLGTDVAEVYGGSISAPVVEEAAKGAVLFGLLLFWRREIHGVLDGIVYATMVGLGFAMTENVFYYAQGAVESGVEGAVGTFIVRGIMSPFAHPLFTAATGIGIGLAATRRGSPARRVAPFIGLLVAMVLHSLWNTAAGAGLFGPVYLLFMVPLFCALVAFVIFARVREGRIIRQELAGVLPDAEVAALGSLRARRRMRRAAPSRAERKEVRSLQRTATELAFARRQGDEGQAAALAGELRRHRVLAAPAPA
jgi:protease PrsW